VSLYLGPSGTLRRVDGVMIVIGALIWLAIVVWLGQFIWGVIQILRDR
jgi:hypothetical protein